MSTAYSLFLSLRPLQWTKNGFILLPLLFAKQVFYYESLVRSLETVVIFCLLSGAMYLINDLVDLEADRRHPVKRDRPLAAGLISPRLCKVTVGLLLAVSFLWGVWIGSGFLLVLILYLIIQLLYNYRLKETVILDTFCVSSGFFLRVIAGALSMLPGGLVVTEGSMAGMLRFFGTDLARGTMVTFVVRLCTLWFAVFLGMIFIFLLRGGRPLELQAVED